MNGRIFAAQNPARKERRHPRVGAGNVSELYHHLYMWGSRSPHRGFHVRGTLYRSEMGHGGVLGPHGRFLIPFRHRQHGGIQHRVERVGVLFSKHVQRRAVRMDPGGLSGAYPRHRRRGREFLGSTLWDCVAVDWRASVGGELKRAVVFGWSGGVRLHDRHSLDADQSHGGPELLIRCGMPSPLASRSNGLEESGGFGMYFSVIPKICDVIYVAFQFKRVCFDRHGQSVMRWGGVLNIRLAVRSPPQRASTGKIPISTGVRSGEHGVLGGDGRPRTC